MCMWVFDVATINLCENYSLSNLVILGKGYGIYVINSRYSFQWIFLKPCILVMKMCMWILMALKWILRELQSFELGHFWQLF